MPQFTSASEKCHECTKTVYLTEKIVVEDKEERRTYHKACLKCSHCKKVLSLGNYASMGGVYYCKPHFKQLFATKGNYDEGFGKEQHKTKWAPSAAPATSSAVSFVPVESTSSPSSSSSSTSTSSPTPARSEDVVVASEEVKKPAAEEVKKPASTYVPSRPGQAFIPVESSSPTPTHAAPAEDKPAAVKKPAYAPSRPGQSFIPVESAAASASKKDSPSGIASRFKSNLEKCVGCAKTVYATEKIVVEDKEDKKVFHKTCLKCSHCSKVLSLGNYAGMGGQFFCKPHFKQLFATKGNYDEGFGKQQHKTKWLQSDSSDASSSSQPSDDTPAAVTSSPSTESLSTSHSVEDVKHVAEPEPEHKSEPEPEHKSETEPEPAVAEVHDEPAPTTHHDDDSHSHDDSHAHSHSTDDDHHEEERVEEPVADETPAEDEN